MADDSSLIEPTGTPTSDNPERVGNSYEEASEPKAPTRDFLVYANGVLEGVDSPERIAHAQNQLVNEFEENTWSNPKEVLGYLEKYGRLIRQKFADTSTYSVEDLIMSTPITLEDVIREKEKDGPVDSYPDVYRDWAARNLEFLEATDDPMYRVVASQLKNDLPIIASEETRKMNTQGRRDALTGALGGIAGNVVNETADLLMLANRGFARVWDPLITLIPGTRERGGFVDGFTEVIDPKYDEDLSTMLVEGAANATLQIAGMAASTLGKVSTLGSLLMNGYDQVKRRYDKTLYNTGSESEALKASSIETVSQGVQMFGDTLAFGKLGTALAKTSAAFSTKAAATVTAIASEGTSGAAGELISQQAEKIETQKPIEDPWSRVLKQGAIEAASAGIGMAVYGGATRRIDRTTSRRQAQADNNAGVPIDPEVKMVVGSPPPVPNRKDMAHNPVDADQIDLGFAAILEGVEDDVAAVPPPRTPVSEDLEPGASTNNEGLDLGSEIPTNNEGLDPIIPDRATKVGELEDDTELWRDAQDDVVYRLHPDDTVTLPVGKSFIIGAEDRAVVSLALEGGGTVELENGKPVIKGEDENGSPRSYVVEATPIEESGVVPAGDGYILEVAPETQEGASTVVRRVGNIRKVRSTMDDPKSMGAAYAGRYGTGKQNPSVAGESLFSTSQRGTNILDSSDRYIDSFPKKEVRDDIASRLNSEEPASILAELQAESRNLSSPEDRAIFNARIGSFAYTINQRVRAFEKAGDTVGADSLYDVLRGADALYFPAASQAGTELGAFSTPGPGRVFTRSEIIKEAEDAYTNAINTEALKGGFTKADIEKAESEHKADVAENQKLELEEKRIESIDKDTQLDPAYLAAESLEASLSDEIEISYAEEGRRLSEIIDRIKESLDIAQEKHDASVGKKVNAAASKVIKAKEDLAKEEAKSASLSKSGKAPSDLMVEAITALNNKAKASLDAIGRSIGNALHAKHIQPLQDKLAKASELYQKAKDQLDRSVQSLERGRKQWEADRKFIELLRRSGDNEEADLLESAVEAARIEAESRVDKNSEWLRDKALAVSDIEAQIQALNEQSNGIPFVVEELRSGISVVMNGDSPTLVSSKGKVPLRELLKDNPEYHSQLSDVENFVLQGVIDSIENLRAAHTKSEVKESVRLTKAKEKSQAKVKELKKKVSDLEAALAAVEQEAGVEPQSLKTRKESLNSELKKYQEKSTSLTRENTPGTKKIHQRLQQVRGDKKNIQDKGRDGLQSRREKIAERRKALKEKISQSRKIINARNRAIAAYAKKRREMEEANDRSAETERFIEANGLVGTAASLVRTSDAVKNSLYHKKSLVGLIPIMSTSIFAGPTALLNVAMATVANVLALPVNLVTPSIAKGVWAVTDLVTGRPKPGANRRMQSLTLGVLYDIVANSVSRKQQMRMLDLIRYGAREEAVWSQEEMGRTDFVKDVILKKYAQKKAPVIERAFQVNVTESTHKDFLDAVWQSLKDINNPDKISEWELTSQTDTSNVVRGLRFLNLLARYANLPTGLVSGAFVRTLSALDMAISIPLAQVTEQSSRIHNYNKALREGASEAELDAMNFDSRALLKQAKFNASSKIQSLRDAGYTVSKLQERLITNEEYNALLPMRTFQDIKQTTEEISGSGDPTGVAGVVHDTVSGLFRGIAGLLGSNKSSMAPLAIPFSTVLSTLMNQAIKTTPLGVISPFVGKAWKNGRTDYEKSTDVVYGVVGTALTVGIVSRFVFGSDDDKEDENGFRYFDIVGRFSKDNDLAKAYRNSGGREGVLKIGNQWVDFTNWPIAPQLWAAAYLRDSMRDRNKGIVTQKEIDKKTETMFTIFTALQGFAHGASQLNYVRDLTSTLFGLSEAFQEKRESKDGSLSYGYYKAIESLAKVGAKALPGSESWAQQILKVYERPLEFRKTYAGALLQAYPVFPALAEYVDKEGTFVQTRPALNILGEPLDPAYEGFGFLKRIWTNGPKDLDLLWMANSGYKFPSFMDKDMNPDDGANYTDADKWQLGRAASADLRATIQTLRVMYQGLPVTESNQKYISKKINKVLDRYKDELFVMQRSKEGDLMKWD